MNYGLFSGAFWGLLFIVAGVLVVLKNIFHLQIPVFKIILGVFFVYLGITMLIGGFANSSGKNIIFSSSDLIANSIETEHNVIFGTGVIDFSTLTLSDTFRRYEVNVIFSRAELLLNPNIPTHIKTSAVFASAELLNDKSIYFGNEDYTTYEESSIKPIMIDANIIFGSLEIKNSMNVEIIEKDTLADSMEMK